MYLYLVEKTCTMARDFVVIRGDVVSSRFIEEKENFWKHIDSVIDEMNRKYRKILLYSFEIVKGDEFTSVCRSVPEAFMISQILIEKMLPHMIRLVISAGELDQGRITDNLNELDGEVFWKASKAIEILKSQKRLFRFEINDGYNDVISSLGNLILELKYEWTSREREIIELYKAYNNQIKVAKKLKISQQSVSDGLRRAKFKLIKEAEKSLIEFI